MNFEELDIVDKLKVYKALNDLSQMDIAEKLQVSQSLLSLVFSKKICVSDKLKSKINQLLNT